MGVASDRNIVVVTDLFKRLSRMTAAEVAWRGRTAARRLSDRAAVGLRAPGWNRGALRRAIDPAERGLRGLATRRQWMDVHREIARQLAESHRFLCPPAERGHVVAAARRADGRAADRAAAQADRTVAGEYDVLGFHGLRYDGIKKLDWHYDPVNRRRAPLRFWSDVPYLEPWCGDHKIIWELNRHQHWIRLGRAYWLTGDLRYRDEFIRQLNDWLVANPPLVGVNWASMLELAFRSLSWLWSLHLFADAAAQDRSPWVVDLLVALDRQLSHIERNLSYYFSPNTHLTGEALALYVCGLALPQLADSARRVEVGRQVLLREIDAQIAGDGGHLERSAHYHRYTLDFYLCAAAMAIANGDGAATAFLDAAARLGFAARVLSDERGHLPQLGDDDGGALLPMAGRPAVDARDSLWVAAALTGRADLRIGPVPEEAVWWLANPQLRQLLDRMWASNVPPDPVPSTALPETGYFVSRSPRGDHLVIDGGPHGFQNGGHAHADALSVTLAVRGRPLLIDPGTGCYTANPALRDRFRRARMHNTAVIDAVEPSTTRGPFHWSRTADARALRWVTNGAFDYFEGTHDGYTTLEHRRHVLVFHGELVVVADLVHGEGRHETSAYWHIDRRWHTQPCPGGRLLTAGADRAQLLTPDGVVTTFVADEGSGLGWQSPAYGRIEPATTVRVQREGAAPSWLVTVIGLLPENPIVGIEAIPVWAEGGALLAATALKLTRETGTDYVLFADPAADAQSTWRVAEFETDARVMFSRVAPDGSIAGTALVEGSLVRSAVRRRLHLTLRRPTTDLFVDLAETTGGDAPRPVAARISGSAGPGARLVVSGRELPVEVDRRAAPRPFVQRKS